MPTNIIIYTLDYQPEGGIVEDFIGSSVVRAYCESDPYPWYVTPVNREQLMELIDAYSRDNRLNEDQRGALVGWYERLEQETDAGTFIAIADRFGGNNGDEYQGE